MLIVFVVKQRFQMTDMKYLYFLTTGEQGICKIILFFTFFRPLSLRAWDRPGILLEESLMKPERQKQRCPAL